MLSKLPPIIKQFMRCVMVFTIDTLTNVCDDLTNEFE